MPQTHPTRPGTRLILASQSAGRARILRGAGYRFRQVASHADETIPLSLGLEDAVQELARRKAEAVAGRFPDCWVLGSDTALDLDGRVIGKARDLADASRMLRRLCGRTHRISTAICVIAPATPRGCRRMRAGVDTARVTLRAWKSDQIRRYVRAVRPLACAGAYAVQEDGAAIVERMDGDPSTVIGLPVSLLDRFLRQLGFRAG